MKGKNKVPLVIEEPCRKERERGKNLNSYLSFAKLDGRPRLVKTQKCHDSFC